VFARIRPALGSSSSYGDAAVDAAQYTATQGLTVQLPDNGPEKRKLILFGPARETVSGSKGELKSYDFQVSVVYVLVVASAVPCVALYAYPLLFI
jgi:hypothetical protein